mmetsp:Transcript_20520/g.62581  ORF Transcript_20520/g.62581 Transcript_20520/m.62581 type:complete len:206 (+) Transcript_20520:112-729(+)
MSRTQRVSNGELPNYGRQHHNPLQQTEQWRARCKNERTGSHKTDFSGNNASLSLIWNSSSDAGEQRAARRVSDLRMQNDFGMHVQQAKANAMASNRPIVTDRHIPAARRSTLQHYVRAGSVMGTEAATYSPVNANTSQEERDARAAENLLAQAAKERERGTNYLRVGNLAQARKHLARAEELLQLDGSKTGILDEMELMKKDSFF